MHLRLTTLVLAAALGVSACSTPAEEDAAPATPTAEENFPTTIAVPGVDNDLVVDADPQRIAALSADAAIALHELGLTDRLVSVPEVALNDTLHRYADEFAAVPNTTASDNSPEPELVLSWNPDLVVVSTRHGGEQDASSRLHDTGVPVLSLTNGWNNSEEIIENVTLIGQATGTEDNAAEIADYIRTGIDNVRARAADATETPSVMILSNQAHVPFINGTDTLVSELVTNGGGVNAAEELGITSPTPIQPEQIVAANPDYIMLVDVTGKGPDSFNAILDNPAVAELPAVQEGRMHTFLGRDVYGLAGKAVVPGSEAVLEWLHPELAQ